LRALVEEQLGPKATAKLAETGQYFHHAVGGVEICLNGKTQLIVGGYETSEVAADQSALIRAIQWLTGEEISLEPGGDADRIRIAVVTEPVNPKDVCYDQDVDIVHAGQCRWEYALESGWTVALIPVSGAEADHCYVSWLAQYDLMCSFRPGTGPPTLVENVD